MSFNAQRIAASALLVLALLVTVVLPVSTLAQTQDPHVPTERELEKQRTGIKTDDQRGYQQRSVETVQSWNRRAIAWVKELLQAIHLTPARLALILGGLGTFYTLGKNKRLVRWAVMAGISYLLVVVGIAAMWFDWPYWN